MVLYGLAERTCGKDSEMAECVAEVDGVTGVDGVRISLSVGAVLG